MTVEELIKKLQGLPEEQKKLEVRRYIEEDEMYAATHCIIESVLYSTKDQDIGIGPHIVLS